MYYIPNNTYSMNNNSDTIKKLQKGELPIDFNWNAEVFSAIPLLENIPSEPTPDEIKQVQLVSEDLRDGLHGVEIYPTVSEMLEYIGRMRALGITRMIVGIFSGNSNKIDTSIKQVLAGMYEKYPDVTPLLLCLAIPASVAWIGECKTFNPNIACYVFMGTAPSRLLVEGWTQESIFEKLTSATRTIIHTYGVPVIGATENTTQTNPDFLKKVLEIYVANGASGFCITDTVGIARPKGVYRLVSYIREVLDSLGGESMHIEWHGHRDMGNDLGNAMAAISAGATHIHTVARGVGERAGNTQLEALLLNFLAILEENNQTMPWDINTLTSILEQYNIITGVPIPTHGPLGKRAFTTSLGIHSSAILKAADLVKEAKNMGDDVLANKLEKMGRKIYTSVDPQRIGKDHIIRISPWSGTSTVRIVFQRLGGNVTTLTDAMIANVLEKAKELGRELTDAEVKELLF